MNPKRLPHDLVRKYLANKCNPEELQEINDWYNDLDLRNDQEGYLFSEDEFLNQIREKIRLASPQKSRVIATNWWKRIAQIAAAGIFVFGLYFVKITNQRDKEPKSVISSVKPEVARQFGHFINTQKKIVQHILPDGSKVWLSPGAKIDYPLSFKGLKSREVTFAGEAFFEVSHDKAHPFKIYSGKLITEVLGTSFNLKAYENELVYQVSVVTGKVAVSTAVSGSTQLKTIVINPNEQIVFEKSTSSLHLLEVEMDAAKLQNWQPVSLKFDDVPMKEVIDRLEHTFSVKITLSSPRLANCRLKIDFENQRLPEILEMINVLLGAGYEINGTNVTLIGDGC
jgi:transmembrane sensor